MCCSDVFYYLWGNSSWNSFIPEDKSPTVSLDLSNESVLVKLRKDREINILNIYEVEKSLFQRKRVRGKKGCLTTQTSHNTVGHFCVSPYPMSMLYIWIDVSVCIGSVNRNINIWVSVICCCFFFLLFMTKRVPT